MHRVTTPTKYCKDPVILKFGKYADGSLAIQAFIEETYEPAYKATCCLVDHDIKPNEGNVFIKNYSENEGVLEALVNDGIVQLVKSHTFHMFSHSITYYECALLVDINEEDKL